MQERNRLEDELALMEKLLPHCEALEAQTKWSARRDAAAEARRGPTRALARSLARQPFPSGCPRCPFSLHCVCPASPCKCCRGSTMWLRCLPNSPRGAAPSFPSLLPHPQSAKEVATREKEAQQANAPVKAVEAELAKFQQAAEKGKAGASKLEGEQQKFGEVVEAAVRFSGCVGGGLGGQIVSPQPLRGIASPASTPDAPLWRPRAIVLLSF